MRHPDGWQMDSHLSEHRSSTSTRRLLPLPKQSEDNVRVASSCASRANLRTLSQRVSSHETPLIDALTLRRVAAQRKSAERRPSWPNPMCDGSPGRSAGGDKRLCEEEFAESFGSSRRLHGDCAGHQIVSGASRSAATLKSDSASAN